MKAFRFFRLPVNDGPTGGGAPMDALGTEQRS